MNKYFHWASITLFFTVFISAFLPSWLSLIDRWNKMTESYSHGYFVVAISAYYLIQTILSINPEKIKANYLIAPLLLASSLVWALSYHAHIEVIHQILLPIMLALFFLMVLGIKAGKEFLFPVLFLCFAIPFWDYLTIPLQGITVFVNNVLLGWVGIAVYIDGFFVTIPAGTFEIAGGCSGLRYLIVALTLSILYSYQNYSRWRTRIALIITAILFALITNWLRIFIIIVVGHITEMESDLIHNHDFFGWGLFAVILIPLFYLAHLFTSWFNDDWPVSTSAKGHFAKFSVLPYFVAGLATLSMPLIVTPAYSEFQDSMTVPSFSGNRLSVFTPLITPVFVGADVMVDEFYKVNGREVQLAFRGYTLQTPGKELVFYENSIFSDIWEVFQQNNERNISYFHLINQDSGQKLLVASQYSVSGYKVGNKMYAKLLELLKPLLSSQFSSVLLLATPCQVSCEPAKVRIQTLLLSNQKLLESL